jgi:ankyrin repeat protein
MEKNQLRVFLISAAVGLALLVAIGFWSFSPGQLKHARNRALVAACAFGDVQAVEAVLAQGADVNFRDENGITPLMHAARGDRPNMKEPAATDRPEVVRLLLKSGADVNAATDSGFVALFWAARYGHTNVVKVLLDHGANARARDKDGLTALAWATTNQSASPPHYDKVIALLKEAGAKDAASAGPP